MLYFPHPDLANEDGMLAIGGDLSPERLLLAYRWGVFPWYNQEDPIVWWHPDPRFVLYPQNLRIAKSMKPLLAKNKFQVTYDLDFEQVIKNCRHIDRKDQDGTWITTEMEEAYITLHHQGFAHSVEVWNNENLVGGLYGVALGKIFYGESMFSLESNASKFGFISLVQKLKDAHFELIDCQQETPLLKSLGADFISRKSFLEVLKENMFMDDIDSIWTITSEEV